MKFQHLLNTYNIGRRVLGPMPACINMEAQDYRSPINPMVMRRVELRLYCEFPLDPRDSGGHAQRCAEMQIMRMLYDPVITRARDIELRLIELGVYDQPVFDMLRELQKVEP